MTRLLIISHTAHYRLADGRFAGWGPTIREISALAALFDTVDHLAMLHSGQAPDSALPYTNPKVRFIPLQPTGGRGLWKKLSILPRIPGFALAIWRAARRADVIHVRCPANISLVALLTLPFAARGKPRWVKYAGNWRPTGGDHRSYRFQRWLIRQPFKGFASINGSWPGQPKHVLSFLNPCLTETEREIGLAKGSGKRLEQPVRILFAGALVRAKGVHLTIEATAILLRRGLTVQLDIAGDGADRVTFETQAKPLGDAVQFHGWVARDAMPELYGQAHLFLFPSRTEGWPKVLSEAMAFGVVPVATAVSSIPQILAETGAGIAVADPNAEKLAETVAELIQQPETWTRYNSNCLTAAGNFTYSAFLERLRGTLRNHGFFSDSSHKRRSR